jgi:hypothetical protein
LPLVSGLLIDFVAGLIAKALTPEGAQRILPYVRARHRRFGRGYVSRSSAVTVSAELITSIMGPIVLPVGYHLITNNCVK